MITNTKLLGTFIGGAAIGSLITFALTKEKYESIINNEIEAMRIFYEERVDKDKTEEKEEPEVSDDLREATSIKEGIVSDLRDYKAYSQMVTVYKPEDKEAIRPEEEYPNEDDYHDEEGELPPPLDKFIQEDKPYPITFYDYNHTMTHIDKIELVYFRGDGIMVDDQDEIIDDIEYLIGEDNLMELGNDPQFPNMMYIRNPKTGADYEIIQNESSFREVILGEPPSGPMNNFILDDEIEDDLW